MIIMRETTMMLMTKTMKTTTSLIMTTRTMTGATMMMNYHDQNSVLRQPRKLNSPEYIVVGYYYWVPSQ